MTKERQHGEEEQPAFSDMIAGGRRRISILPLVLAIAALAVEAPAQADASSEPPEHEARAEAGQHEHGEHANHISFMFAGTFENGEGVHRN